MINMLNTMCLNCKKLNNECAGTENQLWSGCINKEVDKNICLKSIPCCGCIGFDNFCTKIKRSIGKENSND